MYSSPSTYPRVRKSRATSLLTAVVIAGCASTAPVQAPSAPQSMFNSMDPSIPPATKAQIATAAHAEHVCIADAVVSLDDGVSPANVIGHAVVEQCDMQISHWAYLELKGVNPQTMAGAMRVFNRTRDDIGTDAVLRYRATLRASRAKAGSSPG